MNNQKNEAGNIAIVAATGIFALIVGFGVGTMVDKNKSDDSKTTNNSSMQQSMNDTTDGITVGGAKMVKDKDIVDNAVNAKNVTTVVTAVKAAGLVDTLKGEGPFTVFAPNNDAFMALPAGTVDTLLKPENKDQLTKILTYHVVPGTYTSADLKVMASKGESLKTVQGEMLSVVNENGEVKLQDAKGNKISIETSDVISSNGVTHVVKSVMMPAN